jgi:hypothetical protein
MLPEGAVSGAEETIIDVFPEVRLGASKYKLRCRSYLLWK